MNKQPSISPPCHSIFRGGSTETTTEKYTQLWISLINQMERGKKILTGAK